MPHTPNTRNKKQSKVIYCAEVSPSPIGPIWLGVTEKGLAFVALGADREGFEAELARRGFQKVFYDAGRTQAAVRQIAEYLAGERDSFDLPIDWDGMTVFQREVLKATFAIPYGEVATYGELARQIARPRAARAVGGAEAANPIPLVIPCHRVIGSDGALHGYSANGGLALKAWLLNLEKAGRLKPGTPDVESFPHPIPTGDPNA